MMQLYNQHIISQHTKISRAERYSLNGHKSCMIWITGLSGSGKSTIAIELEKILFQYSVRSYILDGDNLRLGLNGDLDFSPEDRKENIRRIGEVGKLFVDAGFVVIASLISPYENERNLVRSLFSENDFFEVYVKCSLSECERRDPKGLYKKARNGIIPNFTGIHAPYEEPSHPDIVVNTESKSLVECTSLIFEYISIKGIR